MSLNRVFRPESDKLSGKLLEYSAKVGAADHLPDHQQAFKKFLSEDFRHHDEWYIEWEVATGKIAWSYGFDTWLGHPKLKDGLNCCAALGKYVHPFISGCHGGSGIGCGLATGEEVIPGLLIFADTGGTIFRIEEWLMKLGRRSRMIINN